MDLKDSGVEEDERGKQLAEQSSPLNRSHDSSPGNVDAGTDQAEAYANDPANATGKASSEKGSGRPEFGTSGKDAPRGFGTDRVQAAAMAVAALAGGNKKKLLAGGGAAGLIGLIIALVLAALPLKIEAMLKNIYSHEFARVDNALQTREEKVAMKYLYGKTTGSLIYSDGTLLGTLYGNMRLNKFEKGLTDKGVKISGDGKGTMKLTMIDGKNYTFKNAADIDRFMAAGSVTGNDARALIKITVDEQTHAYQILKRRHLRRYLRNKYGVRKWRIFDRRVGAAAATEVDDSVSEAVMGSYKERLSSGIDCIMNGSACPDESKRASPDGTGTGSVVETPATDPATADNRQLIDSAGGDAGVQLETATGTVDAAAARAENTTIIDLISKNITKELVASAAAIIGLIDLLSHVDNALHNRSLEKVADNIHAAQYATLFASWATITDQIKDGKTVSGDEVNAAMLKLTPNDGSGDDISKSAGFQRIFENNGATGMQMDGGDKLASSQSGVAKFDSWYINGPGRVLSPILSIWRSTVGSVIRALSDLVGPIINAILSAIPGFSSLVETLGHFVSDVFMKLVGPVIDGTEHGAKLFNGIDAGGDVTANSFGSDTLGFANISDAAAAEENSKIAAANQALENKLPLLQRLTSTNSSQSIGSQFLAHLPGTPQAFASAGTREIGAIATNPISTFGGILNFFIRPASAADTSDPYGVQQTGPTQQMLNEDIQNPADTSGPDGKPDGVIDSYDCPKISDRNVGNGCLLDVAVLQAMNANYTTDDDGGLGGGTP